MDNSIKMLYDEHAIIVNAIDVARQAKSLIGKDDDQYENIITELLVFFKTYADEFHHYKEEEILFPEMIKRNEMLEEGVIKEMLENHSEFREMIKNITNNLSANKHSNVQEELETYTENLLDHIAVENDEVFQIADTIFNVKEKSDLFFRFKDCDRDLGEERKDKMVVLLNSLRQKLVLAE